jgi:hypothetical protein
VINSFYLFNKSADLILQSDDDMGTRNSKTEHDVTGGDADDNGDHGGDHHNDGDNDRVDSVEDDYDMDGDRDGDDRRSDDNDGGDGGDSHSQGIRLFLSTISTTL